MHKSEVVNKQAHTLEQIDKVCARLPCVQFFKDETRQELSLKYLENPDIYDDINNLRGYIFKQALHHLNKLRTDEGKHSPSRQEKASEEVIQCLDYDSTPQLIDTVKPFAGVLAALDDMDRMWIDLYLDCNENYSEMERKTNITRQKCSNRINEILKEWKQLDIYLQ